MATKQSGLSKTVNIFAMVGDTRCNTAGYILIHLLPKRTLKENTVILSRNSMGITKKNMDRKVS